MQPRGSFLESPGNFSGAFLYFKIKILRISNGGVAFSQQTSSTCFVNLQFIYLFNYLFNQIPNYDS